MDVTKKFITGAVGVLLAIAFCMLLITMYKKGNDGINSSLNKYDALMQGLDSEKYSAYVGDGITGSSVLGLLENLTEADEINVSVRNLCNLAGTSGTPVSTEYTYAGMHAQGSSLLKKAKDSKDTEHYINPSGKFNGSLVYDANGALTGLVFTQLR